LIETGNGRYLLDILKELNNSLEDTSIIQRKNYQSDEEYGKAIKDDLVNSITKFEK